MTIESMLSSLGFIQALIRSGHDLLEDIIYGGSSSIDANHARVSSAASGAGASTNAIYVTVLWGQMTATWKHKNKII
jgi:hypothetical protein